MEVTWVRSDRLEENDVSPRRTRENGCQDNLTRRKTRKEQQAKTPYQSRKELQKKEKEQLYDYIKDFVIASLKTSLLFLFFHIIQQTHEGPAIVR